MSQEVAKLKQKADEAADEVIKASAKAQEALVELHDVSPSLWVKIKLWCRNSLTIVWARLCVILGGAVASVGVVADVLDSIFHAPGVSDALLAIGIQPKMLSSIGGLIVIIQAVTEATRRRSLPSSPTGT